VWPIILNAEPYITCLREQVLVVIRFNIIFLEAPLRKNTHMFLQKMQKVQQDMVACFDAVRLFIFVLIL